MATDVPTELRSIAFLPDGETLAAACAGGMIGLGEAATHDSKPRNKYFPLTQFYDRKKSGVSVLLQVAGRWYAAFRPGPR
jgi:hypothetical protein